jgi:hypothetical protein
MKLKKIEVAGFRGFNDVQAVDIDGELIIICGDNHTGKTSFAEALEWLFFGYTCRCHRGKDKYSKTEYKGIYRNVHYPEDNLPYVQLEAMYKGNLVTLRRELIDAEDSRAYLDGKPVDGFAPVGFSPTASHPVIAQHGLRDFIYTNPNSRREILSYVLGLDSLMKLEQDVKDAHAEFRRRKPKDCNTYDRLISEARKLGLLDSVIGSLEAGSLQEAEEELTREIHRKTGTTGLPGNMLPEALSQARVEKEARILDLAAYQLTDGLEVAGNSFKRRVEQFKESCSSAVDRLEEFIRASSDMPGEKRVRFIKLGLELVLELQSPKVCPFCEQETLTEQKKQAYIKLVEEFQDPKRIAEQISDELGGLASMWSEMLTEAFRLIPRLPEGKDMIKLRQLLEGRTELAEYETRWIEMTEQKNTLGRLMQEGDYIIKRACALLGERLYDEGFFEEFRELPKQLDQTALSLLIRQSAYAKLFSAIRPVLEVKISSTEEVRALLLLQDFWDNWHEIVKAVHYNQLESNFRVLESEARSFIADKQKERLEEKEKDILLWYEMLNPMEDITFRKIHVTKTALRLIGQSYGKEIEAPPNFSQSQINCLGLAVYLVQALSVGDLGFVVLDDPIQSMDESHSERLKTDVIDRLIDTEHQVIVLTHLDNFAENLALTHRRQFPYRIEFSSYSQAGPHIKHRQPRLEDYLEQAGEYKKGNAERRRQSGRCLRMAVERITKMLYQQATSSLPAKYQSASFSLLKQELLPKCTQLLPREADGIRATYNFVVSYPHDDMTVEPPTTEQLETHINRLAQLAKKYSLVQ